MACAKTVPSQGDWFNLPPGGSRGQSRLLRHGDESDLSFARHEPRHQTCPDMGTHLLHRHTPTYH
jgi:hypothetical protein